MPSRSERASLALIASGGALLAFTYMTSAYTTTAAGPINSVIGWLNLGVNQLFYVGSATSVGYLLLAIGVWRTRRCDWGSELGFVVVAAGLLAGALEGLVQITYQALWVHGLLVEGRARSTGRCNGEVRVTAS
jgi:hypothetical protein